MKVRLPKTNKKQNEIIKEAVTEEMNTQIDRFIENMTMQMLYVLHFKFGFGQKRLEQFAQFLTAQQGELKEKYEMKHDDIPFLCQKKLEDDGINLDKIMG